MSDGVLESKMVSEEMITDITLSSMKEGSDGVTEYPVLGFDDRALNLLCTGIAETLKYSDVIPSGGKFYKFIKRSADIILSALGLVILSLPMAVVAMLIFAEDGGNPIFSQVRLTENGTPFKMYKFRSMCMDAEIKFSEVQKNNKSDGIAFKSDEDPRITKIGKFIRKTSIDELPQLFNIVRGDMSVIGPRPPLPREVVLYTPEHMNRLIVKGGLSCICQVEGRSDMPFNEWIKSDIEYIKNRSFLFDVKLFFKMISAVIFGRGAR